MAGLTAAAFPEAPAQAISKTEVEAARTKSQDAYDIYYSTVRGSVYAS